MTDGVRITGVELTLDVAGPGARSYAFVIDWHIRLLLALAWLVVGLVAMTGTLSWVGPSSRRFGLFVFTVLGPAAALYLLYHPVLEVAMRGRTPGKRMAGVRIAMKDGSVPGAVPLLIRNLLRLLDSLPAVYAVGLIATLLTPNSVRIGDLAAGTVLVYDRADQRTTATVLAADRNAIARPGGERADLARELLDRWSELAPEARARLAGRLLDQLGETLPPGVQDDELLARLQRHVHP